MADRADSGEILATLTAMMRGEPARDGEVPGYVQRLKAAELLARHHGLLEKAEAPGPDSAAVRAMEAALDQIRAEAGFAGERRTPAEGEEARP